MSLKPRRHNISAGESPTWNNLNNDYGDFYNNEKLLNTVEVISSYFIGADNRDLGIH